MIDIMRVGAFNKSASLTSEKYKSHISSTEKQDFSNPIKSLDIFFLLYISEKKINNRYLITQNLLQNTFL